MALFGTAAALFANSLTPAEHADAFANARNFAQAAKEIRDLINNLPTDKDRAAFAKFVEKYLGKLVRDTTNAFTEQRLEPVQAVDRMGPDTMAQT